MLFKSIAIWLDRLPIYARAARQPEHLNRELTLISRLTLVTFVQELHQGKRMTEIYGQEIDLFLMRHNLSSVEGKVYYLFGFRKIFDINRMSHQELMMISL